MRSIILFISFLIIQCYACSTLAAQGLGPSYSIAAFLDPQDSLSLSQVKELHDSSFVRLDENSIQVADLTRVAWLKISVDSLPSGQYLIFNNSTLDSITVYKSTSQTEKPSQAGCLVLLRDREIETLLPTFLLPKSEGPCRFYVRIKTGQMFLSTIEICNYQTASARTFQRAMWMATFISLAFVALILIIILSYSQPSRQLYIFVLFSACMLLFVVQPLESFTCCLAI